VRRAEVNRREFFKTTILSLLAIPLGRFIPKYFMGVDWASHKDSMGEWMYVTRHGAIHRGNGDYEFWKFCNERNYTKEIEWFIDENNPEDN
jgi:hypothetical protein